MSRRSPFCWRRRLRRMRPCIWRRVSFFLRLFRLLFLLDFPRRLLDAGELSQHLAVILGFAGLAQKLSLEKSLDDLVELRAMLQAQSFEFDDDARQSLTKRSPLVQIASNLPDRLGI